MGEKTGIAWTDHTFNPWMGCHKVSAGCKHCYAETLVKNKMQLDAWGLHGNRKRTGRANWRKPVSWNGQAAMQGSPDRIFCASLADVFEDEPGPNEWRPDLWNLIRECYWLDWQILTKRPENIAKMLPDDWLDSASGWPQVWLGTSIEDNAVVDRARLLVANPSVVHFVSYEPAIGPVDQLDLTDIEWLIAGGESGPGYRPMDLRWVRDIRERCETGIDKTTFFFKQSAAPRTEMGIKLDGEIVRNYPPSWDRNATDLTQTRSWQ